MKKKRRQSGVVSQPCGAQGAVTGSFSTWQRKVFRRVEKDGQRVAPANQAFHERYHHGWFAHRNGSRAEVPGARRGSAPSRDLRQASDIERESIEQAIRHHGLKATLAQKDVVHVGL